MNKLLFFTTLIICSISMQAQEAFMKGDNLIGAKIGIGDGLAASVTYENCVLDGLFQNENGAIGVGGYLGYAHDKVEVSEQGITVGCKYNDIIIGIQSNLHMQFVDRLDTYAGAMLGYEIVNSNNYGRSDDPNFDYSHSIDVEGSGMTFSLHLGARYYLTDHLAANIELGYGVAFANIGLSYRF